MYRLRSRSPRRPSPGYGYGRRHSPRRSPSPYSRRDRYGRSPSPVRRPRYRSPIRSRSPPRRPRSDRFGREDYDREREAYYRRREDEDRRMDDYYREKERARARDYNDRYDRRRSPPRAQGRESWAQRPKRHEAPQRTRYSLLLSNLDRSVNWMDLKDLSRKYGDVTFADANKIRVGEGIVTFSDQQSMVKAHRELNGIELRGSKMVAEYEFPELADKELPENEKYNNNPKSDGNRSPQRPDLQKPVRRRSRSRSSERSRSRSSSTE